MASSERAAGPTVWSRIPEGARVVEFMSDGALLRGWYWPAPGAGPHPVIVMVTAWSAVIGLYGDDYAPTFQAAGFAVLIYDHRNFGASEGEPRQEIDAIAQVRGVRDAISFAATLPGVDPDRIGIWGTSYGGGHVLMAGAIDRRVRCIVSQCGTISGWRNSMKRYPGDVWPTMVRQFEVDRAARFAGEAPMMMAIWPENRPKQPGRTHFDNNGLAWKQSLDDWRVETWRNEVTLRSCEFYGDYEPGSYIDRIAPTPIMMVVAEHDTVTPVEDSIEAFERLARPKELVVLPGGHYDLYSDQLGPARLAAARWFKTHLIDSAAGQHGSA